MPNPFGDQIDLERGPSGEFWAKVAPSQEPLRTIGDALNRVLLLAPHFPTAFADHMRGRVKDKLFETTG